MRQTCGGGDDGDDGVVGLESAVDDAGALAVAGSGKMGAMSTR